MLNKYFDSCLYPKRNTIKDLKNVNKFFKNQNKGLVQLKEDKHLKKYNFIKKYFSNLHPLIHISKKESLKNQFNKIKKNQIKNIKIHPRFLNKKVKSNYEFYKKIFIFCEKKKINIFFCTFASWENEVLENDNLYLIAKLSNFLKDSKLILMHGGGSKILTYYEIFRFKENVFLDLSYTIQHFKNTHIMKDILFCINNLDKRILVGSDYPSKKFSEYLSILEFLQKKIKNTKYKNVVYKNLDLLLNENKK